MVSSVLLGIDSRLIDNDVEIAGHAGHCPLEIKIVLLLGQENGQIVRLLPFFLTN